MYEENGRNIKIAHPAKSQAILEHITQKAATKEMRVNDSKICLMCFSGATSYKARAQILGSDKNPIESVTASRFLGVTIDDDLTFGTH